MWYKYDDETLTHTYPTVNPAAKPPATTHTNARPPLSR
jgi:hypothetical protein